MQDDNAIEGLKRLGLRTYEARVFLALQKLGTGTASEVSEVADVPRSQVYGAAEGLEERGLVETQQSRPTVYQPVPLEQARRQLLDRLAETGAETFDYLETVQNSAAQQERTESLWLIHGSDAIASRAVSVAGDATDRLLYAADDPAMLEPALLDAMAQAAESGVTVVVASIDPAVLAEVPGSLGTYRVPEERDMDVHTGRLVVADDETILLSTFAAGTAEGEHEEVAFWAAENTFAVVLVELAEGWLRDPFQ
jgi:sugar-specific transcriptional regulator TrmB